MVVVPGQGIIPAEIIKAISVELLSTLHELHSQVEMWGAALKLYLGVLLICSICLYALYFLYIRYRAIDIMINAEIFVV